MKTVIASPGGIVSYDVLCEKMGRKTIDSLIEHNIIHLRLTNMWSFDIDEAKVIGPVVTAESVCGLYAMRRMVEQIETKNV